MGWGIDFKADIFLSKQSFSSIQELEHKIEETESFIESCRKELCMYAIANPKDIIPEDWKEDSIVFIKMKIDEVVDYIIENTELLSKLYLLKEVAQENKDILKQEE